MSRTIQLGRTDRARQSPRGSVFTGSSETYIIYDVVIPVLPRLIPRWATIACCLLLLGLGKSALAATCSGGANCTACTDCARCRHCSRGGTCSVCRPDLYRRATTSSAAPVAPSYAPRTAPRYAPRTSPRTITRKAPRVKTEYRVSARCVKVTDGDTMTVAINGRPVVFRLYGVDAPEKNQPNGQAATRRLTSMVLNKPVVIYTSDHDRYSRWTGWVFVGPVCANRQLVQEGLAWWYAKYDKRNGKMAALQAQAKRQRLGLWSSANPIPPWNWRKR